MQVSILVLMELPLQLYNPRIRICSPYVSILVLMELPLQHVFDSNRYEDFLRFNPCFNGTTSATDCPCRTGAMQRRVSILVLMELPLQHIVTYYDLDNMLRFNPCFNGTTSATRY
mgnify:CR=1 FL=1